MPFSPKQPASMIGTFAMVLVFTMFKELFEDYYRMKSDRKINNTISKILNYETGEFEDTKWKNIRTGDIVKVEKDHTFPADILFFYAKTDVIFVDTMNLDGENNLKPKVMASKDMANLVNVGDIREESKEDNQLPPIDKNKLLNLSG
jgi:phospholipid-translocating ATPase